MTKAALHPVSLTLSCLTAIALVSLAGCACWQKHSSAESSSMTTASNGKDIHPSDNTSR